MIEKMFKIIDLKAYSIVEENPLKKLDGDQISKKLLKAELKKQEIDLKILIEKEELSIEEIKKFRARAIQFAKTNHKQGIEEIIGG